MTAALIVGLIAWLAGRNSGWRACEREAEEDDRLLEEQARSARASMRERMEAP